MAAIKDIIVSVSSATATAARQAFGIPLLVDFIGQRSILIKGSGASGIVYKSVVRNDTGLTVSVITGVTAGYVYTLTTKALVIELPSTGSTVRDLIADFAANAPGPVKALFSLVRTDTGSGAVPLHAATPLAFTTFQDIRDISQLLYYYDTTDVPYKVIGNYLASRPTPGRLYLFDAFSILDADLATQLAVHDTGDWYTILHTTATEAKVHILSDYVNNAVRTLLTVSNDVTITGRVQGGRTLFVIHDAPDDHPEISLAAFKLPAQPGSTSWKFAGPLQGQTPNRTATLTDLLAVRAARGNSYVEKSGLQYMDGARMNDPAVVVYMDQVQSRDWISLNLQADLEELFVRASQRNDKIDYTTEGGIEQIKGVIERRLSLAGKYGIIARIENEDQSALSADGAYQFNVTAPSRLEVLANNPSDITNRVLNNVVFQYVEAGAIEGVTVTGRVVLEL